MRAYCTNDYASTLERISGHIVEARCSIDLMRPIDFSRPLHITVNGARTQWRFHPPDAQAPLRRFELLPRPQGGGLVVIAYDDECP